MTRMAAVIVALTLAGCAGAPVVSEHPPLAEPLVPIARTDRPVIAFVLGTVVGMLSAWRRGGFLDSILPPTLIVVSAFPYFWIGLLLLLVFSITVNWFPLGFAYEINSSINLSWSLPAR